MSELGKLYVLLLQSGLAALRNAAQIGDLEHCRFESEHLHEVPSLIEESNINPHQFYANKTRQRYVEWAEMTDRPAVKELMEFFYRPVWNQIDQILQKQSMQKP